MNIDQNAPLTARQEIFIAAPPDKVWAVESDINQWQTWQPDVSSAKLEGELAVGTVFRWKAGGLNITSTLQEVSPPESIGWTGVSIGTQAIHLWSFEAHEGGTRVTAEESMSGWFPRLISLFDPKFLEKSMVKSLQILKAHVEKS